MPDLAAKRDCGMPETHPHALPDCPGTIEISPHAFWGATLDKSMGWRCPFCLVYGHIREDGMSYAGDVHKATVEEVRTWLSGVING